MMQAETPQMSLTSYLSNAVEWDKVGTYGDTAKTFTRAQNFIAKFEPLPLEQDTEQESQPMNTNRRIVQVFIADPDQNVPLEHSLIYKGDQKLTDLTDQELFFEVPIADLMKSHNEKRVKWLDKDASRKAGKDVLLEPARIRDLRMTVVLIAQF